MLAVLALVVACRTTVSAPAPTSAISADVGYLASVALAGRESGSAGADTAAVFIARRHEQLGLRPAFRLRCDAAPCPESYFQPFSIERGGAQNVGAVVDGSDPVLRNEFVVLGAHYDHLGRSPTFSLDRGKGFAIRPGADDNASGTAAVLELARRLRDRPARRSILVVHFDAEEIGLVGSRVFLNNPPVPRQAMRFMFNLDMVGRLRENRLFVEGDRERATRMLIDSAATAAGLRAEFVANEDRSDHATFRAENIAAVSLSTGYHIDYHTSSDIAARVNVAGIERVVDVVERIIRRTADR